MQMESKNDCILSPNFLTSLPKQLQVARQRKVKKHTEKKKNKYVSIPIMLPRLASQAAHTHTQSNQDVGHIDAMACCQGRL